MSVTPFPEVGRFRLSEIREEPCPVVRMPMVFRIRWIDWDDREHVTDVRGACSEEMARIGLAMARADVFADFLETKQRVKR